MNDRGQNLDAIDCIFENFGKIQARSRRFTSAQAHGTNPHAASARAILCGELLPATERRPSQLTRNTILNFSEVGVVQKKIRQNKITRLHRATSAELDF